MKAEGQEDVQPPRPAEEEVAEPPAATPPPLKPESDGQEAAPTSSASAEGRDAVPASTGGAEQSAGLAPSVNPFDQYSALGVYTAVVVATEQDPRAGSTAPVGELTSMVVEHPSARPGREGPMLDDGMGENLLRAKSLPQPGEEGQLLRVLSTYCSVVAKRPCCLLIIYVALLGTFIGLTWRTLDVDSDFGAFIRADGEAMRRRDAYLEALDTMKKQEGRRLQAADYRSAELEDTGHAREGGFLESNLVSDEVVELRREFAHSGDRFRQLSQGAIVCLMRSLTVLYAPKSGNAFDERVLREVRELELNLRSLPGWKRLCSTMVDRAHQPLCDPGHSFGAFSWPQKSRPSSADVDDQRFLISFNARGRDLLPSPAVLAYLESSQIQMGLSQYLPKDYEPPLRSPPDSGSPDAPPKGLRTHYVWYLTVGREGNPMSEMRRRTKEVSKIYETFIEDEVYPKLADFGNEAEFMDVFYYGDVITSYEVSQTLQNDVMWAIASLSFVTCYLWLHTRSLVLSVSSLCVIFASVPLAYVLTPLSKTTIATFLSLFLVTGIGCDVVFVFTDFWEQSAQVERSTGRRLTWVLLHAGRNCLATSLTTSASFFANLASCLQPLREFGLFMGLAVTGAYILSVLLLPPIIVIYDACCNCSSPRFSKSDDRDKNQGELDTMAIVPAGPTTVENGVFREPSWRPAPRRKIARYCLIALANRIAVCPFILCGLAMVIILVFIIGIVLAAELDRGLPDIFPEDHNQVAGNDMQEKFAVMQENLLLSQVPGGAVCRANGSWGSTSPLTACIMHWCDAEVSEATNSELTCWQSQAISSSCKKVRMRTRLASPLAPDINAWQDPWRGAVQKATGSSSVTLYPQLTALRPLVLETWESGNIVTRLFNDMGWTDAEMPNPQGDATCALQTICFSGQHHCSLEYEGWRLFGHFNLTAAAGGGRLLASADPRAAADPRWLQTVSSVPAAKRIDVTVVWGIRAAQSTPIVGKPDEAWSFDPRFEPDNPWAQRAMYAMCENLPAELLVFETRCFIQTFKTWLATSQRKRFPTRDFKSEINLWFPRTIVAQENLWKTRAGQVQAAKVTFILNVDKTLPAGPLLDYKKKWDNYMQVMNGQAAMSGNGAWHTAQAWVRAEAEDAVVDSTVDTIIISAVCAWGGMLAFTCDPVLAFFVLGLVLGIISGLAFFMVVIIGWKIGSIEVISLVIFVGYSVTYSLHVAHSYSEACIANHPDDTADPEETAREGLVALADGSPTVVGDTARPVKRLSPAELRNRRATMSLVHIGGAVLSSAVSTMGSSIFLLCCTMIIFVKLGAVVIAVTLLSVTFALLILPAMLMLCGPPPEPWYKRWVCGRKQKQSHQD